MRLRQFCEYAGVTTGGWRSRAQTWTWALPGHFAPGRDLRVTVAGGTLTQTGVPVVGDHHGDDEAALDAGSLSSRPERSS